MALVTVQDYVRLNSARTQYNPVTHILTAVLPNGNTATYQVQIVNGISYINV